MFEWFIELKIKLSKTWVEFGFQKSTQHVLFKKKKKVTQTCPNMCGSMPHPSH
jgi:hypothetical protein